MKILRLSGTAPRHWSLDLHPRITVVHGLDPDLAGPVGAAIDALVQARLTAPELGVSGLSGRVLIDGEEVGLDALADQVPGLVAAAPVTGPDLRGSVLDRGRLRALDGEVAAAEAALVSARVAVDELRRARDIDLADRSRRQRETWHERARAASALRLARRRVAEIAAGAAPADTPPRPRGTPAEIQRLAAARVDAARRALEAAAAARAEAEERCSELEAVSAVEVETLRAELADLERRCVESAPVAVPTDADRQALAERRAFVDADIESLTTGPTQRVADALAVADADEGIAVVEAARVAVEWERVRDLVAAESDPAPAPAAPAPVEMSEESTRRLARAHDAVSAARRAVAEASGASQLDPTDTEALEAAHAEVLSAWEGSEKRIGVGRARRRLEEAQLAEREILARMGFASYTEFMVSGRAAGRPSHIDIEEARRALREAEARLADTEVEVEQELTSARATAQVAGAGDWDAAAARGRLTATLAALRARAVELLGEDPGDDVAGALRDRISADPLPDLRLALDEVGVPLGEVLSRDAVLGRARDWLVRAGEDQARRRDLLAARAELDKRAATLDRAAEAAASWQEMVARRDAVRDQLEAASVAGAARVEAEERLERDRSDEERAAAVLADAEAHEARLTSEVAADAQPSAPVDTLESVTSAEAEARDAQTALDAAVSHLLPSRLVAVDDPDGGLGRAEARLTLARLELDTLLAVRDEARSSTPADVDPDIDEIAWRLMVRMARHRREAVTGGPGPAPLVVVDALDGIDAAGVRHLCDALAGPAQAVQVIIRTGRDDVAAWAAETDRSVAALAVATAPATSAG